MKIAIDPIIERCEPQAFRRNVRRLLYLACIAAEQGHDVWLVPFASDSMEKMQREGMTDWLLNLARRFPRLPKLPPAIDLVICSNSQARDMSAGNPEIRLVVFKEDIAYRNDRQLLGIADLIPCCVWKREDFTEFDLRPEDESDHAAVMQSVVLPVPWIPHDRVLLQMEADGMVEAYLRDDLDGIRGRYSGDKRFRLGFIGADEPETRRNALKGLRQTGLLDYYETYKPSEWTRSADHYLRWLSQCQAIPELPGDQWNCYRFSEAVMMGVPVVRLKGKAEFTPPLTDANCILLDSWSDQTKIEHGLARSDRIVEEADRCYRMGWSLRGQFGQILRRLGLE